MTTMIAGFSCVTLQYLAVTNSIPVEEKPKILSEFSKDLGLSHDHQFQAAIKGEVEFVPGN